MGTKALEYGTGGEGAAAQLVNGMGYGVHNAWSIGAPGDFFCNCITAKRNKAQLGI